MAQEKDNISLAFRQARVRFKDAFSEIENRIIGQEPSLITLDEEGKKEVVRLHKFVVNAVNKLKDNSKVKDVETELGPVCLKDLETEVDLVPLVTEDEWKSIFTALNEMNIHAECEQTVRLMKGDMEKAVRKLCGKVKSKRTVEQIMIKSAKLHPPKIITKKFFDLIHPHFCLTLENQIEFDLLPILSNTSDGTPKLLVGSKIEASEN